MTADEQRLLAAFEGGELTTCDFSHRQHLHIAWLLLSTAPLGVATERFLTGLRDITRRAGQEQKVHVTLSWVFMITLDRLRSEAPEGESFDAFIARSPELADPRLALRHYPPELLGSAEARARFVLPLRDG